MGKRSHSSLLFLKTAPFPKWRPLTPITAAPGSSTPAPELHHLRSPMKDKLWICCWRPKTESRELPPSPLTGALGSLARIQYHTHTCDQAGCMQEVGVPSQALHKERHAQRDNAIFPRTNSSFRLELGFSCLWSLEWTDHCESCLAQNHWDPGKASLLTQRSWSSVWKRLLGKKDPASTLGGGAHFRL